MSIKTTAMATAAEEEDTGQNTETSIKMPAMAKVGPARREAGDLRMMPAEEALMGCDQRGSEGQITLREAAWVLGIGAGRTWLEEVDRRVHLQVQVSLSQSYHYNRIRAPQSQA